MNSGHIQDQVKLPAGVALQVVLQGMRIRFGRSLVTIMGVVLGIAFLMSILTAQALKRGVAEEQNIRLELQRMGNFLKAEMGPPAGKDIGILQAGSLSLIERRFLESLVAADVGHLNWHAIKGVAPDSELKRTEALRDRLRETSPADMTARSRFVLLMGDASVAPDFWEWTGPAGLDRIGTTQNIEGRALPYGLRTVTLARQLRPEEEASRAIEAQRERYRGIWIVLISLLVTVIGIANAMLMSVTERFREIGTMKCLGALSRFIRQIFLFESCLIGAVGGIAGSVAGAVFSILIYALTFGVGVVMNALAASIGWLLAYLLLSSIAGIVLSVIAALYPARVASRMVPSNALRSNI